MFEVRYYRNDTLYRKPSTIFVSAIAFILTSVKDSIYLDYIYDKNLQIEIEVNIISVHYVCFITVISVLIEKCLVVPA